MSDKNEPADPTFYWLFGYILIGISSWIFFDSTKMTTLAYGYIGGLFPRGGIWDTSSMAIIFVPLLGGLLWLIYNFLSGKDEKWAKALSWSGLAIVAVEILSRVRFHMMMKTSHFLLILLTLACGLAMLLRARIINRQEKRRIEKAKESV